MGRARARRGRRRAGTGRPGPARACRRPGRERGRAERHAAGDQGRARRRAQQPELAAPEARPDRAEPAAGRPTRPLTALIGVIAGSCRPAPGGSGPGRPGSRRRRRPRAGRRSGAPLRYVPFVLSRSSRYQARPRNVRTACSVLANGSSTTIVLLTSRPRVATASSGNAVPTAGSLDLARRRRPAGRARSPARAPRSAGRAGGPGRRRTGRGRAGRGTGAGPARSSTIVGSISRPRRRRPRARCRRSRSGRRRRGPPRRPGPR